MNIKVISCMQRTKSLAALLEGQAGIGNKPSISRLIYSFGYDMTLMDLVLVLLFLAKN
jgi:hypothetical protein